MSQPPYESSSVPTVPTVPPSVYQPPRKMDRLLLATFIISLIAVGLAGLTLTYVFTHPAPRFTPAYTCTDTFVTNPDGSVTEQGTCIYEDGTVCTFSAVLGPGTSGTDSRQQSCLAKK